MPNSNKLPIYPALTGYRAIVAWMIFFYHFFPFKNPNIPIFIKNIVSQLHIGVDMFFVLSGFLITYRYYSIKDMSFKNYMVNRIARIYPMYFILTLATFVVLAFGKTWTSYDSWAAFFSFTMTKGFISEFRYSGISQGWTLSFEELFYISAPLFLLFLRKNKIALITLPICIFIITNLIASFANTPSNQWGILQPRISVFIFEFFAGITASYVLLKYKNSLSRIPFLTYFGLVFILFYIVCRQFWQPYITNVYTDAIDVILLSYLGIASVLYGLATENTFISKILSNNYIVLLGKSSYIFYLIHKGFIPIFIDAYITGNKLLLFILLNLISIFLFKLLEEPINKKIRTFFAK